MHLARLIEARLAVLGLSQSEAARRVGVERRTLIRWLDAETVPDVGVWVRLAQVLGIDATEVGRAIGADASAAAEVER